MIHIGIDTGVKTGFAAYDTKKRALVQVDTMTITRAMDLVMVYRNIGLTVGEEIMLHIEDARLRKWFGNAGREKLQGAGSVKRDARIWEDFCKEKEINFEMVPPRNNTTKLTTAQFRYITGWKKTTSEHARDAAMLVYGLNY